MSGRIMIHPSISPTKVHCTRTHTHTHLSHTQEGLKKGIQSLFDKIGGKSLSEILSSSSVTETNIMQFLGTYARTQASACVHATCACVMHVHDARMACM
jgi:hypothetical protein